MLDVALPVPLHCAAGRSSRARQRARDSAALDDRVNRALSAVQQLASGHLGDQLFQDAAALAAGGTTRGDESRVAAELRGPISRCMDRRPAGAPAGAAAVARQQGVAVPGPGASGRHQPAPKAIPNRGISGRILSRRSPSRSQAAHRWPWPPRPPAAPTSRTFGGCCGQRQRWRQLWPMLGSHHPTWTLSCRLPCRLWGSAWPELV